jgi:hypothetical protein
LDLNRDTVAKIYDDIDSLIHTNISRQPIKFLKPGIYEADETYLEHVKLSDGSFEDLMWIGGILYRDSGESGFVHPARPERRLSVAPY